MLNSRACRSIAALALAASGVPLAAAPPPASSAAAAQSDTIVVTGQDERTVRRRIGTFVDQVTRAAGGEDLPRFNDKVCPAAYGLSAARAVQVVARMRRVAEATGVPLADAKCTPNVLVVIVPDKRILIEGLAKRDPSSYFGELPGGAIHKLAVEPGHAASWATLGPPINARGVELFVDPVMGFYTNTTTEAASRLHSGAHPQYYGAVVVIEAAAIEGLSVTQLADYAAVRTFAGVAPKWLEGEATDSILGVIDAPAGSEVPLSLTRLDEGLLRGLYASPGDSTPSARRARIRAEIAREMKLAAK